MRASVCTPVLAPNKVRGGRVHSDHPFVSLASVSWGRGLIRTGNRPGWSESAARPGT